MSTKRTNLDRAREYERENLAAARDILNEAKRTGETGLRVDWAHNILARHTQVSHCRPGEKATPAMLWEEI